MYVYKVTSILYIYILKNYFVSYTSRFYISYLNVVKIMTVNKHSLEFYLVTSSFMG
jgi:hypothetical protein